MKGSIVYIRIAMHQMAVFVIVMRQADDCISERRHLTAHNAGREISASSVRRMHRVLASMNPPYKRTTQGERDFSQWFGFDERFLRHAKP